MSKSSVFQARFDWKIEDKHISLVRINLNQDLENIFLQKKLFSFPFRFESTGNDDTLVSLNNSHGGFSA